MTIRNDVELVELQLVSIEHAIELAREALRRIREKVNGGEWRDE